MLGDRPVIVSGGEDGTVRVWDLASGSPRGEPLPGHEGWVGSVALGMLGDRPVIVSGGEDATVRVWEARDGDAAAVHIGTITFGLVCAATGTVVVSGFAGLMALDFGPR
jgi:WD40 repeat protein